MPVAFSVQQGIEGMLWLMLPIEPNSQVVAILTYIYLVYAKVLWPVYAPLAALLLEPDRSRWRLMLIALAAGVVAAMAFGLRIMTGSHEAIIGNGHIVYDGSELAAFGIGGLYVLAVVSPLLLSSHRMLRVLGLIVTAGAAVSYVFFWQAFSSVWCFFAAAASVVVLAHFVRQERAHCAPAID
jgi:hypothetical protein